MASTPRQATATSAPSSSASGRAKRRRGVLDLLPPWMLAGLAGRLFGRRWFARRVVLDDWFFHAAQPPLAAA